MRYSSVWVNHSMWLCRNHIPGMKFPAQTEMCLMGCGSSRPDLALRPEGPPIPAPVPPPQKEVDPLREDWSAEHRLNGIELGKLKLDRLRRYATYGCAILGASKIPNGKAGLIERILRYRREDLEASRS